MHAKVFPWLLLTVIFIAHTLAAEAQAAGPSSAGDHGCAVEGVVLDENGNPVGKAEVRLTDLSSNVKVALVKTGKNGHYRFAELRKSSYRVQAGKNGRESDPADFSFAEINIRKQNLQLKSK